MWNFLHATVTWNIHRENLRLNCLVMQHNVVVRHHKLERISMKTICYATDPYCLSLNDEFSWKNKSKSFSNNESWEHLLCLIAADVMNFIWSQISMWMTRCLDWKSLFHDHAKVQWEKRKAWAQTTVVNWETTALSARQLRHTGMNDRICGI